MYFSGNIFIALYFCKGIVSMEEDEALSPHDKLAKAQKIVIDIDYENAKEEISTDVNAALDKLTNEIIDRQSMAAERYENFLNSRKNQHILFIELGVGYNTPVIIKYPFWQMAAKNPKAVYACINRQEAVCPKEIQRQSICIEGDIGEILQNLNK